MLEWNSYPQECRKRVREAKNGLKSNVLADPQYIHNKNLSVSEKKLFGRRLTYEPHYNWVNSRKAKYNKGSKPALYMLTLSQA